MQSPACLRCSSVRTGSTASCLTGRGVGVRVAEERGAGVKCVVEVEEEVGWEGLETVEVNEMVPVERGFDFCLGDEEEDNDDACFGWWYCWSSRYCLSNRLAHCFHPRRVVGIMSIA